MLSAGRLLFNLIGLVVLVYWCSKSCRKFAAFAFGSFEVGGVLAVFVPCSLSGMEGSSHNGLVESRFFCFLVFTALASELYSVLRFGNE